ncbi:roadblock/LC7 domain-containing protein [Actinomadura hibisca]|uniref:roadblock/LC7 domain-containing protein n=1 Tax=Actinomadura hibisca TaxID=68565 RepID=UPI000ACEED67|nr:roadblock/LC7 domain-containing protein [Actinomadura hibisca]
MTERKRRLGELMGRLTKVAMPESEPGPAGPAYPYQSDPVVLAELTALRRRIDRCVGSLVASSDGMLIAHDLPPEIEPAGMAALTASELALSHRMASTAHGGGFHEVVVHGTNGYVVVYSAGWTASLTVLAGPGVNVGRLHLESRPAARAIGAHLAPNDNGTTDRQRREQP